MDLKLRVKQINTLPPLLPSRFPSSFQLSLLRVSHTPCCSLRNRSLSTLLVLITIDVILRPCPASPSLLIPPTHPVFCRYPSLSGLHPDIPNGLSPLGFLVTVFTVPQHLFPLLIHHQTHLHLPIQLPSEDHNGPPRGTLNMPNRPTFNLPVPPQPPQKWP